MEEVNEGREGSDQLESLEKQFTKMSLNKQKRSVTFQTRTYRDQRIQRDVDISTRPEYDTTIIFKEKHIRVSRAVLKDRCPYFRAMLQAHFHDGDTDNVRVTFSMGVRPFKQVLEYLHTGAIELSPDNLSDVCATANFFLLDSLEQVCRQLFKNNLDCFSVDFVHNFADEHLFADVSAAAFDFKMTNFDAIWRSGVFRSWAPDCIREIVSSDRLVVTAECKVLTFTCEWLIEDFENRDDCAVGLLENLRYSFLQKSDLDKVTEANENSRLKRQLLMLAEKFRGVHTPPRLYHYGLYALAFNSDGQWELQRYFPGDGSVKRLQAPQVRKWINSAVSVVVVDGKLYAVEFVCHDVIVRGYDPLADMWAVRATASIPQFFDANVYYHGAVCCFKGELHLFYTGRETTYAQLYTATHHYTRTVLVGCVETQTFRSPRSRVRVAARLPTIHSAAACGDSIYILQSSTSTILQYTPSTRVWSDIPCPYNLENYQMLTCKSKLLFVQCRQSPFLPPGNHMLVMCPVTREFQDYFYHNLSDLRMAVYGGSLYTLHRESDGWIVVQLDPEFLDDVRIPVAVRLPDWKSGLELNCYAIVGLG